MVTVHRAHGLRFVIFVDDHAPVHVFGDGEAKINIATNGGDPELIFAVGMTRAEIRRALAVAKAQQPVLLERWSAIHG